MRKENKILCCYYHNLFMYNSNRKRQSILTDFENPLFGNVHNLPDHFCEGLDKIYSEHLGRNIKLLWW